MLTKTKKRILLIAVPICILIIIPMLIYYLTYGPKPLLNELPDEEIVSVVRVIRRPSISGDKSPDIELSQDKISLFFDLIKDLKYKKRFNPLGYKYIIDDDIHYIINYDNYTVRLREHYLSVSNNNGEMVEEFQINEMKPNGVFDEIEKLFFEE